MWRHLSLVIAGVGIGLVSVASAAPPDTAQKACDVVTREEAAAAVGAAVAEGKLTAGQGMSANGMDVSGCMFKSAADKELNVSLWRFSPSAKQTLDVYRGLCAKKEQAAGLGDMACWYNKDHAELQVLKGSVLLIFQLRRHDPSAALTTVAKQAVGHLR